MNISSISQKNQIVWNKENVSSHGMKFIKKTQKKLSKLEMLWKLSQDEGFYSKSSIEAANKYKSYAKEVLVEMSMLNCAALKSLSNSSKNDSDKSLQKIVSCSGKGMKYLDGVIHNYTYYPTELNKFVNEIWKNINILFLASVPTSGVLNLTMWMVPSLRPENYASPFERALPIWATCFAIQHFVKERMVKPQQQKLENAKIAFKHS